MQSIRVNVLNKTEIKKNNFKNVTIFKYQSRRNLGLPTYVFVFAPGSKNCKLIVIGDLHAINGQSCIPFIR